MTEATKLEKTIILPFAISISTVEALADEIRTHAAEASLSLTLDAANTEILTTPGIQLLLSLEKTLEQTGGDLRLINAKDTLTSVFQTLGLKEKFERWSQSK